jgi:hypothetical protein
LFRPDFPARAAGSASASVLHFPPGSAPGFLSGPAFRCSAV